MADEDIKQGEFVIEYVGEGDTSLFVVFITIAALFCISDKGWNFWWLFSLFNAVIDDKTCEDRLWKMKHLGETNFYLCEINRDMVIDATYKGNKSRYINHSCDPNTEMQKWFLIDPYFWFHNHNGSYASSYASLIWFAHAFFQENWWWNQNWHICNPWHKKGGAPDLWLSVWALTLLFICIYSLVDRFLGWLLGEHALHL